MSKAEIKMNQEEMLKYYRKFDPIEKKYGKYFQWLKEDYDEIYAKCYQYENDRRLSDLTKKEFGDIYENLKLVYGSQKLTDEIVEIYDLVYDKVINQYLNIDGMERLFSENYINFEWEMHLGIDYADHSMKFYRDHFIHQVRDAYCMDLLLGGGYAAKIKEILGNEGNSKISRYVCKLINQQLERKNQIFEMEEENRREFYLENVIYMSSYMSALFHDIGYPEVANMQSGRNILAYIANVYNFGSGHVDFDRIIAALQNSLLFRVVSPKEIRERIEKEKIDHGAVSALMFLLHFYENGAIYGLEPYEKCAVEIAGLAIYNHTNTYAYILEDKNEKEASYQKSVFVLNPVSYLLRICDDLQEWDRIYFEISSNANIIFCKTCYTPIVRRDWESEKDVYYLCNCNKGDDDSGALEGSGVFETVFRRGSFPYRRLYNVTVCKELVYRMEDGKQVFELNYDLERLLYVAYINPSYAKYRVKELNQLKKMFVRQDMEEMTYIQYFMSANILFIKAMIVGRYLEHREDVCQLKNWIEKIPGFNGLTTEQLHLELTVESWVLYDRISRFLKKNYLPKEVKEYFDINFRIYIYLYLSMKVGMYANSFAAQSRRLCYAVEDLWSYFKGNSRYTADVLILLKDCCMQAARLYENLYQYNYYPDKYFNQFSMDKGIEAYFYRFAQSDNYQPINQREARGKNKLDAYSDLYFFKIMLREMNEN